LELNIDEDVVDNDKINQMTHNSVLDLNLFSENADNNSND